jgi:nucleoside-diphosphate-sugar epimerase
MILPPKKLLILGLGRVGFQAAASFFCWGQQPAAVDNNDSSSGGSSLHPVAVVGTVREDLAKKMPRSNKDADAEMDGGRRCTSRDVHRILYSDEGAVLEAARASTHLLIAMPPPAPVDDGSSSSTVHYMERIVNEFPHHGWLGLVSTTGVYRAVAAASDGGWVDENSAVLDGSAAGQQEHPYIAFENRFAHRDPCIFRCAGLYSNEASALHTVYRSGLLLFKNDNPISGGSDGDNDNRILNTVSEEDDGITNRVHVEDVGAAIAAAMHCGKRSEIYNLSDDCPERRSTVFRFAASLLRSIVNDTAAAATTTTDGGSGSNDKKTPASTATTASARAKRRRTGTKKVCNRKMKQELLPQLKYPSYKEGLTAIMQDKSNPWWNNNQ